MAKKPGGKRKGLDEMYTGRAAERAAEDMTPKDLLDQKEPAPRKRSPLHKGYIKTIFSMGAGQLEGLRREATRRAARDPDVQAGRKSLRPDASALVREAVDQWLREQSKREESKS